MPYYIPVHAVIAWLLIFTIGPALITMPAAFISGWRMERVAVKEAVWVGVRTTVGVGVGHLIWFYAMIRSGELAPLIVGASIALVCYVAIPIIGCLLIHRSRAGQPAAALPRSNRSLYPILLAAIGAVICIVVGYWMLRTL